MFRLIQIMSAFLNGPFSERLMPSQRECHRTAIQLKRENLFPHPLDAAAVEAVGTKNHAIFNYKSSSNRQPFFLLGLTTEGYTECVIGFLKGRFGTERRTGVSAHLRSLSIPLNLKLTHYPDSRTNCRLFQDTPISGYPAVALGSAIVVAFFQAKASGRVCHRPYRSRPGPKLKNRPASGDPVNQACTARQRV